MVVHLNEGLHGLFDRAELEEGHLMVLPGKRRGIATMIKSTFAPFTSNVCECSTYGKNLNAFTSKLLAVNASLISSSVTVALQGGEKREKRNEQKVFTIMTIFSRRSCCSLAGSSRGVEA
jgi:hypothetical protein